MATMTAAAGMGQMGMRSRTGSMAERNRGLFDVQRKARRGPTPEVFFAKHIDNSRIVKADDPVRRREMRTFTAVMGILFVLVMVYVWQHLSAIEVGYQVEAQKVQLEQMREENRQLRLVEAKLTDPVRIDRIAKQQLGLDAPQPGQVVGSDFVDPSAPALAQVSTPAIR
jgi:cell division protein FtsL